MFFSKKAQSCPEISEHEEDNCFEEDINVVRKAIDEFLNSNINKAEAMLTERSGDSIYCAVGAGTFAFLRAIMTFEEDQIKGARHKLEEAAKMTEKYRKKDGFIKWMAGGSSLLECTPSERHAELLFAETVLLRAMLAFASMEGVMSFIKGTMQIKSAHGTYKKCWDAVVKARLANGMAKTLTSIDGANGGAPEEKGSDEEEDLAEEEKRAVEISTHRQVIPKGMNPHFLSGVQMGFGSFNLFISLLPPQILSLFKVFGFAGKRSVGLAELHDAARGNGMRGVICELILLCYYTTLAPLFDIHVNLAHADSLMLPSLKKYPNGALHRYFNGRLCYAKKDIEGAIKEYNLSIGAQNDIVQLHHSCWWELNWCHGLKGEWEEAANAAMCLARDNKWSKAVFTYLHAAHLLQLKKESLDLGEEEEAQRDEQILDLISKVPTLRIWIAGRTIPLEKFVIRKHRDFLAQGDLLLPADEMMYLWNCYSCTPAPLLEQALTRITASLDQFLAINKEALNGLSAPKDFPRLFDERAIGHLLKGAVLSQLGRHDEALACLQEVTSNERKVAKDHYVLPYAHYEIGRIHYHQHDYKTARVSIQKSSSYTNYSIDRGLSFRLHNMSSILAKLLKEPKDKTGTAS